MNIAQALQLAATRGVARLDAQLLLLHAMGGAARDRSWLIAHDSDVLDARTVDVYESLCARRVDGEPVAYVIGHKEFRGLNLQVDARVLVPRPDTETLVEWSLEVIEAMGRRDPAASGADELPMRVIDLGTGSGAIALALRHARSDIRVEAVDASTEALAVARANARALGLAVAFRQAEWLDGSGTYELIVSNPPYVAAGDPHLVALRHEPLAALASGQDGLDDIRRIVASSPSHLSPGGWLLLEHGHDQAGAVRQLLRDAGFDAVGSRRDLAGIERCTGGIWRERG